MHQWDQWHTVITNFFLVQLLDFLIVGIFGHIQMYTFFPPSLLFSFVSSSSHAFLIASLGPVLLLVRRIRSRTPSTFFFLVLCALIALEPVLEQALCRDFSLICVLYGSYFLDPVVFPFWFAAFVGAYLLIVY